MTYVLGVAGGLVVGVTAGLLKYLLLWRPILKGSRACSGKNVYGNMGASMMINIITLLTVYFARHIWPYSFEATLVAAALSLGLMGKLFPLTEILAAGKAEKAEKAQLRTEGQNIDQSGV
ncbi:MAG: hypothetical protein RR387_01760 [Clostridiales bacterium]